MKAWRILGCLGIWLGATLSWAEGAPEEGTLVKGFHPGIGWSPRGTGGLPFLNPERFHMSQSYSFQFISTGKQSWSTGMYLNTISYEFAIPLSMQLKVGYMHDPSMLFRPSEGAAWEGRLFIPDFRITYRPKENVLLQFRYHMVPAGWPVLGFRRGLFDVAWDEIEQH